MKNRILSLAGLVAFFALASVPAAAQQTGAEFMKLAIEQSKAKNYKEAERFLGECIRIEPRNLDCLYRRALVRQLAIGYGLALEDYNAALAIAPNNHILLTARGGLYMSLKRPDEGLVDLNKAIQLAPAYTDAYYRRGNLYRDKGDQARAIADYSMAVILDPKHELSYVNRGSVHEKLGDKDAAIKDYTWAISANPDAGPNYYYRGKLYLEQGKTELSEADFAKAIQLDPTLETLVKSSRTLASTSKLLANMKTETAPKSPAEAARSAGYAHSDKKEWDLAIAQFNRAIGLEPNDYWNYIYRGRAYAGKGDYTQALADLNKGVSMAPPGRASGFLTERARLYFNQGKYALALEEVNKSIVSKPQANEFDLLLRGKIYAAMGNKAAARADLERAVQMNQNLKEAKDELVKL